MFSSSEIAISYPGALYFKPKFALETVPGTIFSAKFGPSTIKFVYAKFRYHGKWGLAPMEPASGRGDTKSFRYTSKVNPIQTEVDSIQTLSRYVAKVN